MASASHAAARHGVNFTRWNSRGELIRLIAVIALPVIATNSLQTLISFVDTRMVSVLGAPALAAMSIGRSGMFLVLSVFMGLGVGVVAYVSRLIGAQQYEQAKVYATLGLLTGGAAGLLLMCSGYLIGEGPISSMVAAGRHELGSAQHLLAQQYAWDFLSALFLGFVFMGVQFAAINIFNAHGKTSFPMWLLVISNVVNLFGNWLLIPGPGAAAVAGTPLQPIAAAVEAVRAALGVPALGITGSGLATALTYVVSMSAAVYWLRRGGSIELDFSRITHPLRKIWDMLRIGLPVTLQMSMRSVSMLILLKLITWLPDSVVGQSALQVGIQVESIAFMPAFAFMTACATLVGQNLGAQLPRQARSAALYCLAGNQAIMIPLSAVIWFFPEFLVRLFIGDNAPEVIPATAGFLKILALCLPGLGASQTLMGALRGSGDTAITAWISMFAMYAVRLPLAIYLAFSNVLGSGSGLGWGITGIWWAMTISVYVEMTLTILRFSSGKWAQVKLRHS